MGQSGRALLYRETGRGWEGTGRMVTKVDVFDFVHLPRLCLCHHLKRTMQQERKHNDENNLHSNYYINDRIIIDDDDEDGQHLLLPSIFPPTATAGVTTVPPFFRGRPPSGRPGALLHRRLPRPGGAQEDDLES